MKSPFKFLDSYTREDRNIFFGRDQEKRQSAKSKATRYEMEITTPCKGWINEDRTTSCYTDTYIL